MEIYQNSLKIENEILKRLLKDGYILINFGSIDCDGCSTSKVLRYESLESIYSDIEDSEQWSDGPFSYSIPLRIEDGSLDLNEQYNGGQWSN